MTISLKSAVLLGVFTLLSTLAIGQSYFPLSAGNTWTMQLDGVFNASGEAYTKIEVLPETTSKNGKTYYKVRSTMYSNPGDEDGFSTTTLARAAQDGNIYGFVPSLSDQEELMMPATLSQGTSWSTDQGTNTVISMSGSVETPAKTYTNCVVVEIEGEEANMKVYLKKGIGYVATEMNGALMMYMSDYDVD